MWLHVQCMILYFFTHLPSVQNITSPFMTLMAGTSCCSLRGTPDFNLSSSPVRFYQSYRISILVIDVLSKHETKGGKSINQTWKKRYKINVAFHLGRDCLQKYPFKRFWSTKGKWEVAVTFITLQKCSTLFVSFVAIIIISENFVNHR